VRALGRCGCSRGTNEEQCDVGGERNVIMHIVMRYVETFSWRESRGCLSEVEQLSRRNSFEENRKFVLMEFILKDQDN
jgi:hypothetical protein